MALVESAAPLSTLPQITSLKREIGQDVEFIGDIATSQLVNVAGVFSVCHFSLKLCHEYIFAAL